MIKDPLLRKKTKNESRDSPKNRPARFVADGTFGRDGQITLHPLMWHGDVLRNTSNEIEDTKTTTGRSKGGGFLTPSSSSMMSLPTLANVVHLQLLMALTAHRLCDLNLQTSQLNPCDVTPVLKKYNSNIFSAKFKIGFVFDWF